MELSMGQTSKLSKIAQNCKQERSKLWHTGQLSITKDATKAGKNALWRSFIQNAPDIHNWIKLTSGVAASDTHQILDIHQTLIDLFLEEAKQLFYLETVGEKL